MLKLLPHQSSDARLMADGDDLPNFSKAGTGKTHTTLEAIRLGKFQGGAVIAPSIALPMWAEEIEKFLGASVEIIKTGKSPIKGKDFQVLSYGIASNPDVRQRLRATNGGVLVLDESHALKTPNSKRTQAVYGVANTGRGGLYEIYDQCYSLTGTPIMRHADDLWAQLRAIQPDVLREYGVLNYDDWVRKFCISQVRQYHPRSAPKRVVIGSMNAELLGELLYSPEQGIGAIRRTMDEVSDTMPPLTYRNISVPIKQDSSLTAALRGKSAAEIEALLTGDDVVMAKAWRTLGELKVDGCIEYVAEVSEYSPVLLGYWHTKTGDELQERLSNMGLEVARVQGSTPMSTRELIRKRFNAGKVDVLVGQISSMNVSWNLQECGNHVVILEDHFSPGLIEQFIKRVWRYGQENHVQCDFIKSSSELDRVIGDVRARKTKFVDDALM